MSMLTTKQVAERLGVTQGRVRALIKVGRLPSQQFGRDHLIKESDLYLVADRKPGRPRKTGINTNATTPPTADAITLPPLTNDEKKAA
jgi:excisionase family DNA binding protein